MKVFLAMILLETVAATLTLALPTGQERHHTLVPDLQDVQRSRRSPDDKKKAPGGFGVDVYEEDKVGVVGKVHGHGTVWQSDDGKSRVQAHGQWSKVLDGPQRSKPHHNAGVDVYEEDKVGVVGKVHGHGTVWQSDDGKSRVQAHGQWSKVLDGPQRSKPHHNAGISFSHDFGDD